MHTPSRTQYGARTKSQRTKSQPLVLDVGVQTFLIYTCMHVLVPLFMYTYMSAGKNPNGQNPNQFEIDCLETMLPCKVCDNLVTHFLLVLRNQKKT